MTPKILFENKYIIAAEKPSGVLSQGAAGECNDDDMLSIISEYAGRPCGLLNRLDRCTGGIILFSKDQSFTGTLSSLISDRENCKKEYLAVVSGMPGEDEGELFDYLLKDGKAGKSYAVKTERKGAKKADLSYKVLAVRDGEKGVLSLVRIRLGTGRTHQIRVQFSSRSMPIAGDGKYGSREKMRGEAKNGISPKDMIALHAFHLTLDGGNKGSLDVYSSPYTDLYPFSIFEDVISDIIKS